MSTKQETSVFGITPIGLLGVSFVVLKLTKVIDWSWWLVTLPFWGGLTLAMIIVFIYFLIYYFKK